VGSNNNLAELSHAWIINRADRNTQPWGGTQRSSLAGRKVGAGSLGRTPPTRRRRGRPVPLQKFELQGARDTPPCLEANTAKRLARLIGFPYSLV